MFLQKICNVVSNVKLNLTILSNAPSIASNILNVKYCTIRPRNYYSVLGVKPKSTNEEIKEAYYSLSKKYHPDLNLGNKNAETKILEINEAFEVLGNKLEKEKYDNKMFPKAWEKQSFIYEHEKRSKPEPFIYRRTFKAMSHSYDQFLKHRKADIKRKHRHGAQKVSFDKSQSSKHFSKVHFKKF